MYKIVVWSNYCFWFEFNVFNFFISSLGSNSPSDNFLYCSSYFPVLNVPFPLILFLISTIPLLHSKNVDNCALHKSGSSLLNSGLLTHSFGVCLSIITHGDLCKQIATCFNWSLQLATIFQYYQHAFHSYPLSSKDSLASYSPQSVYLAITTTFFFM